MFLTRLPVGRTSGNAITIADAAWAFPIAGIVVGLASGLSFAAASLILPPLPAAILATAVATLITGALHEDGLADMADGFGGGADTAEKLAIMRDSQIGSFGTVALIFNFALTVTAIAEAEPTVIQFIAIGAASRAAIVIVMALVPAARTDGLGQGAVINLGWRVALALLIAGIAALTSGLLSSLVAIAISSTLIAALALRQIKGQTGDVFGAIQKIGETAAWVTAAALTG